MIKPKKIVITLIGFLSMLVVVIVLSGHININAPYISIITDQDPGEPVVHGLKKLTETLKAKNIIFDVTGSIENAKGKYLIVTGLSDGNGSAAKLLKSGGKIIPSKPEALTIWYTSYKKKQVLVLSGFDDRGLMYALLETATRIGWSTDKKNLLSEVEELTESPEIKERAVSVYTMNKAYWESRFYDENYWADYLDMLAQNRFNMLTVIFGYENSGFMAPPYPYFFDVEEYPDVHMSTVMANDQDRNLKAFNRLIRMAHDRGIGLTAGIWDHIYRGGVQDAMNSNSKSALVQVSGLEGNNLTAYTKVALAKFIRLVPEIDAIQFRMHDESGLKPGEQFDFWQSIFKSIKATTPDLRLVLRAKGLPDAVIKSAIDEGVNFSISTKYWMEQMGLPFHPTHINRQNQQDRRHSYADMLKYPQEYEMYWRLWNGGTTRILLWGDPDYARRFIESTHIYKSYGFEVNEPLATKMESEPHNALPFDLLNPQYRYYDREFERYWHFFQVFGRIGYNPDCDPDLWHRDFENRFGKNAGPVVESALHTASQVLPRIVASCFPYSHFPTTRGWAEKQRLGDLPVYSKGERSDCQQFASFEEEAQLLIDKGVTAKIRPQVNSKWFEQKAMEINKMVSKAEEVIGAEKNKEFNSTMTDLKILAELAQFHSLRIPAAVSYCLFEKTGDPSALDKAIYYERLAMDTWRKIIIIAGDVYTDNFLMGLKGGSNDGVRTDLTGHWKTELEAMEKGVDLLQQKRNNLKTDVESLNAPEYKYDSSGDYNEYFNIKHNPVTSVRSGSPITITVAIKGSEKIDWVNLRYRSVNQREDYQTLPMVVAEKKGTYRVTIQPDMINAKWNFMYFIEIMDVNGRGVIFPDLNKETPYIIVNLER